MSGNERSCHGASLCSAVPWTCGGSETACLLRNGCDWQYLYVWRSALVQVVAAQRGNCYRVRGSACYADASSVPMLCVCINMQRNMTYG